MKKLALRACGINQQGASVISQALMKDKQIESLDLAFNTLELVGTECISDMVQVNTTLLELNLRSNSIGALGGQALIKALGSNKVMTKMIVADNGMGAEIIAKISGRLNGTFRDVLTCAKNNELKMHSRYIENRYSRFEKMMKKHRKTETDSD